MLGTVLNVMGWGGDIVVIIKGSNNLVMETYIVKLSASYSVVHDGQRDTKNLRWMGKAVQVTTLVTT